MRSVAETGATFALPYRSVMDGWSMTTEESGKNNSGLPRADRSGLTHLRRYVLKEGTRNRVDLTRITSRAGIGRNQR